MGNKNNSGEFDVTHEFKKELKAKNVASLYLLNSLSVVLPFFLVFIGYLIIRNKKRSPEHDGIYWHYRKAKGLSLLSLAFSLSIVSIPSLFSGQSIGVVFSIYVISGISYIIYKNVKLLFMLVEHETEETIEIKN